MAADLAAHEQIGQRLQESLARLRRDIDRVELWAGALEAFSQPIPDYEAGRNHQLAPKIRPAKNRPSVSSANAPINTYSPREE